MNMAVSGIAGRACEAHARPSNFGQLNSAITRERFSEAQGIINVLDNSSTPAALAVKARGSLEPISAAIATGDAEAAAKALGEFRTAHPGAPEPSAGPDLSQYAAKAAKDPSPNGPSTHQMIMALLAGAGSGVDLSL